MAEKLIYPWDLREQVLLEDADPLLCEIYDDLCIKYPILKVLSKIEEKWLRVVDTIISDLRPTGGRVPWSLVASNSPRFLNTLSILVPAIMAATFRKKPINVHADMLIEYFRAPLPFDDFIQDPVGEELSRIRSAGLLVWENFGELRQGSNKYASRFSDVLMKRMTHRRATLFLCTFVQDVRTPAAALFRNVEETYGTTASETVKESASLRSFQVQHEPVKLKAEIL